MRLKQRLIGEVEYNFSILVKEFEMFDQYEKNYKSIQQLPLVNDLHKEIGSLRAQLATKGGEEGGATNWGKWVETKEPQTQVVETHPDEFDMVASLKAENESLQEANHKLEIQHRQVIIDIQEEFQKSFLEYKQKMARDIEKLQQENKELNAIIVERNKVIRQSIYTNSPAVIEDEEEDEDGGAVCSAEMVIKQERTVDEIQVIDEEPTPDEEPEPETEEVVDTEEVEEAPEPEPEPTPDEEPEPDAAEEEVAEEAEEEVDEEEVDEEEVAEEEVAEEAEEEVAEEDDSEYFQVSINGKDYCTSNTTNGAIYEITEEEEIGDKVGKYVDGKPIFDSV